MSRTVRQSIFAGVAQKAINADSASRANVATSASYAATASVVLESVTSASFATSASYALSSSYADAAKNTSTINVNVFGSPVDSYLLFSNVAGTTGVAIGGDADLRYNANTNVLTVGNISATTLTGSLQGTSSWAVNFVSASNYVLNSATSSFVLNSQTSSFVRNSQTSSMTVGTASYSKTLGSGLSNDADGILRLLNSDNSTVSFVYVTASTALNANTSSFIRTLNQNVIITGSVAIGTGSVGTGENNLILGPAPAGGTGEGGQIAFLAVGGTYTSSSFIDNYQNQFRVLSGPGAVSNAGVLSIDLGTRNAKFEGAVTASAYNGLPNDYLYVNRNIDQTIVSGTWANRDVIFNNNIVSKGITYNTGTGLASLTGGKVYRITARLAWAAGAAYLFQFACYNSSNTILGPTVEIVQSTNGTNNISDGTLDFIYAPGSNVDVKIRTTANTNALTGEYIRGDLNTQLIIQQIA